MARDHYFAPISIKIAYEMEQIQMRDEDVLLEYEKQYNRLFTAVQIIFQRGGESRKQIIEEMNSFWDKYLNIVEDVKESIREIFK